MLFIRIIMLLFVLKYKNNEKIYFITLQMANKSIVEKTKSKI